MAPESRRYQYRLATLLGLMLVASLLLGAWRIGWERVVFAIAVSTGVLSCLAWIWFKYQQLRQ
jgi:hypothetical protein